MQYIVDGDIALSRPPKGPLAAQIAGFAEWARDQGYARCSRYRQVLLAACFSRWLGQQAISGASRLRRACRLGICDRRARRVKLHRGDAAALRQFLEFLRHEGVIPPEKVPPRRLSPVEHETQAFETYLRNERVLADATIAYYVPFVRGFLGRSVRHGPRHALTALCRRCRAICPAPGRAPACETREAADHRAAVVPALCAVSRGHRARFGRRRSNRGELVDVVDSSSDSGRRSTAAAGLHQSADRGRPSRLRHPAGARTPGTPGERSGPSRARRHRLGRRTGERPRQGRIPDRPSLASRCRRGDRRVPPARTARRARAVGSSYGRVRPSAAFGAPAPLPPSCETHWCAPASAPPPRARINFAMAWPRRCCATAHH